MNKSEDSVNEERDLQPVLIKVLQIAASATKCACTVVDTHKSSNQFIAPVARPDGALIASGDIALWTQVVILFEFKVKAGKTEPGDHVWPANQALPLCVRKQHSATDGGGCQCHHDHPRSHDCGVK